MTIAIFSIFGGCLFGNIRQDIYYILYIYIIYSPPPGGFSVSQNA